MQNTDIHIDTSGFMDLQTCYPPTLSPKLHAPLNDILNKIGAVAENITFNNDENPTFRIKTEGLTDTNVVTNFTEYELKYPSNIYRVKHFVDLIRKHKKDIIGFNPATIEHDSENLPEWQQDLLDEGWIPTDDNDIYCDTITDIRMMITCRNNVFQIVPKEYVQILSVPSNGWSSFELEGFHAPLSYIDDVPVLILEFIRNFKLNGQAIMTFDCEGYDFTLVFTCNYDTYAITDEDKPKVYRFDTTQPIIMDNLIHDIKDNIDLWAKFPAHVNSETEIRAEKRKILELIQEIEKIKKIIK